MKNQETYEQIERYLANDLGEAERRTLEAEMAQDVALAEQVSVMRKADALIADDDLWNFRSKLQAAEAQHQQHQPSQPQQQHKPQGRQRAMFPARQFIAAAAVLATVAIALWLLFFQAGPPTSTEYLAQHYSPYEAPGAYRSATSPYPEALTMGFQSYEAGNYTTAIGQLQPWLADSLFGQTAQFYTAQAHLAQGNTTTALPLLQELGTAKGSLYQEPAQWYLVLAYLKAGNLPSARAQAGLVAAKASHAYRTQAQALTDDFPEE